MNDNEVIETLKHEAEFRKLEESNRMDATMAKIIGSAILLAIMSMSTCSVAKTYLSPTVRCGH